MKLCKICDRKIEGSWCKTCRRFVKTYELSDRIHFNESHDPENDKGCTYHTVEPEQTASYTGSTVRSTVTTTRPAYTQTGTGTKSSSSGGKKTGKIVVAIVIIYLVLAFLGVLIPVIKEMFDSVSEGFKEGFREAYEDELFSEIPEQEGSDFGEVSDLTNAEKLTAMDKLVPFEESVEDSAEVSYVFRYYDPEEIAKLGFACDEEHFDWRVPEFEAWLAENWSASYEADEDISPYYNYFYEDEEYTWLYFSTFRDYYESEDFAVRIGYDTATGQLHLIGFVALLEQEPTSLYYTMLKELEPDTEWSEAEFFEALKEALESEEEYVTFYSSDEIEVDVQVREGYYSVTFYPAYKY